MPLSLLGIWRGAACLGSPEIFGGEATFPWGLENGEPSEKEKWRHGEKQEGKLWSLTENITLLLPGTLSGSTNCISAWRPGGLECETHCCRDPHVPAQCPCCSLLKTRDGGFAHLSYLCTLKRKTEDRNVCVSECVYLRLFACVYVCECM